MRDDFSESFFSRVNLSPDKWFKFRTDIRVVVLMSLYSNPCFERQSRSRSSASRPSAQQLVSNYDSRKVSYNKRNYRSVDVVRLISLGTERHWFLARPLDVPVDRSCPCCRCLSKLGSLMTYSAVAWAPATLVPDSSSDQGRSGGKSINQDHSGKGVRVEW